MKEFKVNNITIQSSQSGITIKDVNRPANTVDLDKDNLADIISFLSSYRSSQAENRIGFRVPMESLHQETQANFSAIIEYAGDRIKMKAVDVSITGILVDRAGLEFANNETVVMTLSYKDKKAIVRAIVVRCDGSRIAFHFPETLSNGELDPPDSIMAVYRTLETDWLKERIS